MELFEKIVSQYPKYGQHLRALVLIKKLSIRHKHGISYLSRDHRISSHHSQATFTTIHNLILAIIRSFAYSQCFSSMSAVIDLILKETAEAIPTS